MGRGNIHRRVEDLEQRVTRRHELQHPAIRPEVAALLDEIAARKRAGCLTPEDEEFLGAAKAEIKRREARGEISRWGGGR